MMFNYKSTNLSSTTSLPSLLSSSIGGSSHHLHNPLSVLTTSGDQGSLTNSIHNNNVGNFPIFGQSQQQICLECALAFLFDKSQLSLRKIKLLDVLKQLVSPSSMLMSSLSCANSVVNLDHVCGLLLSTCLKVILPSSSTASSSMIVLESSQALKMKPNNQTSCLPSCAENNIIEEVIRMWLEIVPTDKLLSRDFALIVRMMSGISQEQKLGDVCTNFLCLLLDKICTSLQSEDCWNIVSIPVEAFSSLLTILINNFISTQAFSKVENEQKSDVLFIILKLCQIVQLHSDSSRIGHNLWSNAKSLESFLDTILACLLKADDEDLHINAMAVLHCLVRFDKEALDVLSIIDYRRLIDALISVILSPNISIQIICNQLILECSTKSQDATLQFVNSDISDFLFEALSKDTSGEFVW